MKRGVWCIPANLGIREQKKQYEVVKKCCEENDIILESQVFKVGKFGQVAFGSVLHDMGADVAVVANAKVVSDDPMEFYAYKCELRRRHYDLIAVENEFSGAYRLYEGIIGKFVDTVCRIELENEPIRKPHDRRDKAARGAYIGGNAPMGYKAEGGKLVVNPEEVPVVELIMERKHQGKTMLSTLETLNAGGYKTRRGKPFAISTVQSIWNNEPFYRGMYRIGKDGEWVKGQHEAILKEEK